MCFPRAKVSVFHFTNHLIKPFFDRYIGNLLASLHSPKMSATALQGLKKDLFQSTKDMINAFDEDAFIKAWKKFQMQAGDATINSGQKKTATIVSYMEDNWLSCTKMWSRHCRRHLPLQFTYTTNRVERFFGVLKAEMKVYFTSAPTAIEFIPFYINFLQRKHTKMALKSVSRYCPNDRYQKICLQASKFITK